MKLDPDAQELLDAMERAGVPPHETLTVAEARAAMRRARQIPAPERDLMRSIDDLTVGGEGPSPAVRRYVPERLLAGPAPALLYFHGGGNVIGDLDCFDGLCCRLADQIRCVVFSVEYRLAPEAPFPAAIEDGQAALDWLRREAVALGVDPARIAIGGDSAGAGLAASLVARGGGQLGLAAQMLFYPVVDQTMSTSNTFRNNLPLRFTPATMRWFRDHYMAEHDPADPLASPLLAELAPVQPPAYVLTCGADPLGEEGIAYARKLEAARIRVRHRHHQGQMHGLLVQPTPTAAAATAGAAAFLREIFGS